MNTQLGIDFAMTDANQVDLKKSMKATDLKFAIVRGTYGTTRDSTLPKFWKAFQDAGLVRGVYMFPVMQKGRDPEPQVAALWAAVKAAGGIVPGKDLPPVLDVEFPKGIAATGLTRMQCIDWILRAVNALKDTFGCLPMLYTSARVWDGEDQDSLDASQVPTPTIADCPLWLARYPYKYKIPAHYLPAERNAIVMPAVPKELGDSMDVWVHQYQGDAVKFPGISRTVDLNRFFPLSQRVGAATSGLGYTIGERVAWVQRKVRVPADGRWGDDTERAVREFQSTRGLTGDGVVGLRTFCAMAWT